MRIKALKTFLYLAEHDCNFGGHKILGIPRSSMWAHINELEAETGLKLIERRKQHSSFTQEGTSFIPYAAKIIKTFEEGLDKARASDTGRVEGKIVISTTVAIAHSWLTQSIKDFHLNYPNLSVNIIAEDSVPKKTEMAADILLRPIGNNPNFVKKWHILYHHGLFASKDYLARMGIPKSPEDLLSGHSILGYGEHEFSYFEDINWHIKGGWGIPKLTPTLTINSTAAVFSAAGEGIGICSAPIESNTIFATNLVRILPQIDGPIVRTFFCTKVGANSSMERNLNVFRVFFEQYLMSLGIKIYHETE
jgi:DNA-binding transcriptional LysR family regulator